MSMGYITPHQASIWDLRRKGHTQSAIAKQLKRSIQFVHKTLVISDARITKAILETAKLNHISLQGDIDLVNGIAFGFHEPFGVEVAITYSSKAGMQIWYKDNGECSTCRIQAHCRQMICDLYEERHFDLPKDCETLSPRMLSERLFEHLRKIHNRGNRGELFGE